MRNILGKLSLGKSLPIVVLAVLMFWASSWQWTRYLEKKELVATYKVNPQALALTFPAEQLQSSAPPASGFDYLPSDSERLLLKSLRYRKVALKGHFDFANQLIVTNRRSADGPGHNLLSPFILSGSGRAVIVSRGFIPYPDRKPEDWKKYDFPELAAPNEVVIEGVVQESIVPFVLGPSNPNPEVEREPVWYFEEVSKMARQLPYSVVLGAFVQQLGTPPRGKYPEQAVSIRVPPSTHFGYSIEWAILGVLTLIGGIIWQVAPWRRPKPPESDRDVSVNI